MIKLTKFKDIPQFISDGAYQVNYPLTSLIRFIEEEVETMGLQLNPNFQRGHVWTKKQQIAWLEYHLRGGKSGNTIYFNNPFWHRVNPPEQGEYWERIEIFDIGCVNPPEQGEYSDYVCVDGLQRITAAQRFIHNELKVFGSYFSEYEDKLRLVNNNTIVLNVNDLKTEKEVLQWYIDMNAGGTPHSSEEIQRIREMIEKLG